jgi:AcrR family transcriptional regulator
MNDSKAATNPAGSKSIPKTTRAKILKAARKVFGEHPYHSASIRMIGKAAGLDHPLVSYYFRSKADLFETVLAGICEEYYEANAKWFQGLAEMDPQSGLTLYIDRLTDFTSGHPETFRILLLNMVQAKESHMIPGYRFIENLFDRAVQTFRQVVPMRASDHDIDMFTRSFNTLIVNYLGAGTYYARTLGLSPDSDEYLEWVKKSLISMFLPHLKGLIQRKGA